MRWRLRTLMAVVALFAVVFASSDPLLAFLLIFGCPFWLPVIVSTSAARASDTEQAPSV
jgi:hypothetical protein